MTEPTPWACPRCGRRLHITATTAGCRPCGTIAKLHYPLTPADDSDARTPGSLTR